MATRIVLSLSFYLLFKQTHPCNFQIWRYDDSGSIATNTGYTRATYTELKTGGALRNEFLNFLSSTNNAIQSLGTWTTGNNCLYYAGPCTIATSTSTSCDSTSSWTAGNTYYLCPWSAGTIASDLDGMQGTNINSDTIAIYYGGCVNSPTSNPTPAPTINPTQSPTLFPTPAPTKNPTLLPTKSPTNNPTVEPTINPSKNPTLNPSITPTISPTQSTVSPTNNPTLKPTINPSLSPTKNPTPSPTLPEGQIIDNTNNINNTQNGIENKLQTSNVFNGNNIIYIIICVIGLFLICCILFAVCFYKIRIKKRLIGTNITHMTMEGMGENTSVTMIQLGSISPKSMNSMLNGTTPFDHTTSVITMSATTNYENGMYVMDNNRVTVGRDNNNNNNNNDMQLPELPDNGGSDEECDSLQDNEIDNELYNEDVNAVVVTTGGGPDMDMYRNGNDDCNPMIPNNVCKLCDKCGKSVNLTVGGKLDENDRNWYCNECQDTFGD